MAYSDFKSLKKALIQFDLETENIELFASIVDLLPSSWLNETLQKNITLPLNSEKARSEALVAPILYEIRDKNEEINIFSGESLNVDFDRDLNGECDFILAKNRKAIIDTPIFTIIEAKKDDTVSGLGQCAAQMYGALVANQRAETGIEVIYGCVTTGEIWQFMKLENNTVWIDERRYYIDRVERILGVLQWIVDQYK